MDILDGYTIASTLEGQAVEYRPMLAPERMAFYKRVRSSEDPEIVILDAIRKHVIWYDHHLPSVSKEVVGAISGRDRKTAEAFDASNLYFSTYLTKEFPHLAVVTCDECKKYEFYPLSGKFMGGKNRVERVPNDLLLCQTQEGCPKGSPCEEKYMMPLEKNKQAVEFHDQCAAVGHWPDDPIVRQNAEIIIRARKRKWKR